MQSCEPLWYALIIGAAAASLAWNFARSRAILDQWAAENDFQILDSDYRFFCRGPFFWNSSKGQTVYRVTVLDERGDVHTGWVRCGSWFWGIWRNETEVRWDEQSSH